MAPPDALTPCEPLTEPSNKSDTEFKGLVAGWIKSFQACRAKQSKLAEAIDNYNSGK